MNDHADPFTNSGPDPFATRDPNGGLIEPSTDAGNFAQATDTQLDGEQTGDMAGLHVLGEIARGGMGVIYRAHDLVLNRTVAVKVLQERYRNSPAATARFLEEAQITAQLQHPGIPPVHQVGALPDGRPFLAMKLIRGRTLADLLSDPLWDRAQAVGVFEQICHAVAYAHDHGVIHRDLKPQNVMVGRFNEVQVMDWGLAKFRTAPRDTTPDVATTTTFHDPRGPQSDDFQTRAGSLLGTPAYMPPEQAIGAVEQVSKRSDVFGLGAILCAILTGKPPYVGTDSESTRQLAARAMLGDAQARLSECGADPELVSLCKRCLSPEPAARPENAGEVAQAVATFRAAAEQRARSAELDRVRSEGERAKAEAEAREQRKRRKVQRALEASLLVIVAGGAAAGWWAQWQAADRRLDNERRESADRERKARNADAVAGLLDRLEAALKASDATGAGVLLTDAQVRMPEGGAEELAGRLADLRADLAVLRELDAADQFRWTVAGNRLPDRTAGARRIREAFARSGMDFAQAPAAQVANRIAGSVVREQLIAALDLWLVFEPSREVRDVLRAVDRDAYRDSVRDAEATGDLDQVRVLASREEAFRQPPGFVIALRAVETVPVARSRELLQAALRDLPTRLGLLMAMGGTYANDLRGEAADGTRWFQAAVVAAPGNVAAHNNLAVALKAQGDLPGAVGEFQKAIAIDPNYPMGHYNLGVALQAQGDLPGAVAEYHKAIDLDPRNAEIHSNLGNALKAHLDLAEAVAEYQKAIAIDPNYAKAHNNLGNALKAQGDLPGAVAEYQKAIALDSKYANAHRNLGKSLQAQGDLPGAVGEFQKAIAIDPKNAGARIDLGVALRAQGDLSGAMAVYREVIAFDPRNAEAHNNLGVAMRARGDLPGAMAEFKKAIDIQPKYTFAHANLALAHRDQGELEAAVAGFREAARLSPTNARIQSELRATQRQREILLRLPDVAVGRARPRTPAEGCEFARLAAQPFQRRYSVAIRLFAQAFAADPVLTKDPTTGNCYTAASAAVLAAAGRDADLMAISIDEWGYLTGRAHDWLRADLAAWTERARDPKAAPIVRRWLSSWKKDNDLAAVRDPAWLAAMPAADRERWTRFWTDVDALVARDNAKPSE